MVDVHQQRRRHRAVAVVRQVLDELEQPEPQGLGVTEARRPGGQRGVGDELARAAAPQAPGRGEPLEVGVEQVAVQLGHGEPARPGAVAVVGQPEVGLGLGPPCLVGQQARLVHVGQLAGDPLDHPARGLSEAAGVHPVDGLGHERRLAVRTLGGGHRLRQPLGGIDDHPHLSLVDAAGRERLPGRVVAVGQGPGQPDAAAHDGPGRAGQPGGPRVGAGRGLVGGDPARVGLGEHRQLEGGHLRLQRRQVGHQPTELAALQRPDRHPPRGVHRLGSRSHVTGHRRGAQLLDRHVSTLPGSTDTFRSDVPTASG